MGLFQFFTKKEKLPRKNDKKESDESNGVVADEGLLGRKKITKKYDEGLIPPGGHRPATAEEEAILKDMEEFFGEKF